MNININQRLGLPISDFEFLSLFKNKCETVYLKLIKETDRSVIIPLNCKLTLNDEDEYLLIQRLFVKHQKEGFGVFFTVNNGGSKQASIKSLSAHFVDMDFGKVPIIKDGKILRDENNKYKYEYRTEDEIEHYKRTFLSNLSNFKLIPNIVVETKNGFHIYWLLDKTKPHDLLLFTPLQVELINYFGNLEVRIEHADISAKSLERLLRLINFAHLKNPNDPFTIKCIYLNADVRYTQEDIAKALSVDISNLKLTANKHKINTKIRPNKTTASSDLNARVHKNNTGTEVDYKDIFQHFRREIDLRDYLTINCSLRENFSCVFHNDKHPSAQISQASDGSYRYFCNSSNCNYSATNGLDIIDMVKLQRNLSTSQALKYLCDIYNIKIINYNWIKKETSKYEENYNLLNNFDEFSFMYPHTHKLLRYAYPVIFHLLFVARNSLQNSFFQCDGNSIFFISNRYLAKEINKSVTRTNQYINLLCVLGLINKINDNKIPKDMLVMSKELAKENRQNRISFYTIPNFQTVLFSVETKAKLMHEYRFSINSMSKKYIENILGIGFADSIYLVPVKDSKLRQQIREKLESIVMKNITTLGYASKDIILYEEIFIDNEYIKYSTRRYELNRIIPDLMQKYDLVYIKGNKNINSKLGIDTKKYIIVSNNLLI